VPALDGLRGVAIALVVSYHFVYLSGASDAASGLDRTLWKVAGVGWSGVDLFFVLSGFLITGILYDAKAAAGQYFRSFYGRRVLRIFPVYYVILLLLMFALPLIDRDARDAAGAVRDNFVWYAAYLTNVRPIFHSGINTEFLFAGHLWSLAVEEQFYLVWPLVVLICSRRALVAVCLIAIVTALALRIGFELGGAGSSLPYELMPARMDTLAVGALVALAARDPRDLALLSRWMPPAALAAAVSLAVLCGVRRDLAPPFDAGILTLGLSSVAIFFGGVLLVVLAAAPGTAIHTIFSQRPLMALGRYSYALYLVHLPVAVVLMQRFDIAGGVPVVGGSTVLGIAAFCTVAATISLSLAWVSWHVWEQQFLKMKVWFPYGRREPGVEPATAPSLLTAAAADSLS
jgi:peptidoglycan/LPS O-acetylase OafA/YrhL